jgi:hypothetical protein
MVLTRISVSMLFSFSIAHAQCVIYDNQNIPLRNIPNDPLSFILHQTGQCPSSIQALKEEMKYFDLSAHVSMVANRGKNNPSQGSFSFFESIYGKLSESYMINKGEFYLGYFTDVQNNQLILDQSPKANKLLIELIAWDRTHQIYNFYELRGLNKTETRWYFRGDSKDALLDNQYLYRDNLENTPKFGGRMRCSACHNSGGPIMKEIQFPHNDWWTNANKLKFSPNHLTPEVRWLVNGLVNSNIFSKDVKKGMNLINNSQVYQSAKRKLSLQEQLRPLFCTTEINLESNVSAEKKSKVVIPSSYFLNPLLADIDISISHTAYLSLLKKNHMHFPETKYLDSDHAWLTPVKGYNDINAISTLIKQKIVTAHFAESVMMIDFQHPVFSASRCQLLKYLPETTTHWEKEFMEQLAIKQASDLNAKRLFTYLSNRHKYAHDYFNHVIMKYKNKLISLAKTKQGQQDLFQKLIELRAAVHQQELSKNPKGEILEPGFRVIFPEPSTGNLVVSRE